MVDESTTNSQVTDSVTQSNLSAVGNAPASTQGLLDTVMAETIGMSMHNAVSTQQNSQMIGSAAVAATCARLLNAPVVVSPPPAPGPLPLPVVPPVTPPRTPAERVAQGQVAEEQILKDFATAVRGNDSLLARAKKDIEKLELGPETATDAGGAKK